MRVWSHTDKGVARTQNQDYYRVELFHEAEYTICAVCDGMGGARAGNVASEIACQTFFEEVSLAVKPTMNIRAMREALKKAVKQANLMVFEKSRSSADFYGMGTTLVGGVIMPTRAVIVNVGDSRAYLADAEGIQRVTRDHSLVEDLLERGDLSAGEAKNHPKRNLITRALGTEADVQCDIFTLEVHKGDHMLFCSDGLTNVVEEQEILYEMLHGGEPQYCCKRLVDIANKRGGPDNITVALIQL
ncbi:MAG: Stp1/IreP family PP2C-type Ser/Thr phosphatase [Oscillospiraceae bacterium]|jgi:protein phosphatase|nr:Stp1/IreP family PP2C-type Ser/Thr phosphatase [Oscillospiraceae bacterium]